MLTPMELEYAVTTVQRQELSVLRTIAQQASVGDGGFSPSTAGKHTDKEDKVPEHGPPIAATPRSCSATRMTATSATNA